MPPTDTAPAAHQLVHLARYPLDEPGGPRWRRVVATARRELRAVGCSVLPDFVAPAAVDTLREQGAAMVPHAHHRCETVNAYNIALDTPLPSRHPGRIRMRRGNAFVARDRIPADSVIARLYGCPVLRAFVAECFELPEAHQLADPLAGLVLNVVPPGEQHPWHFDTNELTVSLLTQRPVTGGGFEYCPDIRSVGRENLDDVRAVLTGGGDHLVRRLDLRPGDLQLFRGRCALHRVTPVAGPLARHSAILAYSERPGVLGRAERTRQLFGRVSPRHRSATGPGPRADRADALLD